MRAPVIMTGKIRAFKSQNSLLTSVAPPSCLHGNRIGGRSCALRPTGAPLRRWPPAPPSPAAPRLPARPRHERMLTASGLQGRDEGQNHRYSPKRIRPRLRSPHRPPGLATSTLFCSTRSLSLPSPPHYFLPLSPCSSFKWSIKAWRVHSLIFKVLAKRTGD